MNTQLPFLVKLPLVLITLLCLGYLASIGQFILAPLLFAFFLSILFTPFASFLERRLCFNRPLSTIAAVAVMILILAGISYFFANQLSDLSNDWPLLKEQVTKSYNQFIVWIQRTFNIRIDNKMPDYLQQGMDKLLSSTAWVATLMLGLFSSSIGFAFFSVLFFFFILNYRRLLHNFIISVFREQHLPKVREVIDEVQRIVKKYITGLILQILMVSTMTTVFLSILGVKYAVLLGVLTGLLNVIPYLGIFIAFLISFVITFATGGASAGLFVALGYIGVHAIDGNLILPLVVGSKVKINALFSFLAILVGESLWGISGMFLCIPTLAIIKIIFDHVPELQPWGRLIGEANPRKKKRKYRITKKITLEEKD